jgi:TldD protein
MDQPPERVREIQNIFAELVEYLEKKFPYSEASFSEYDGLSIAISRKETKINETPARRGAVLTVFNGDFFAEIGASDLSRDHLYSAADTLLTNIPVSARGIHLDPGEPWVCDVYSEYIENPFAIPLKEKLDHLQAIREELGRHGGRVVSSFVRYGERITKKVYVNRKKRLFQQLLQTSCIPAVIVSDGKTTKVLHAGNGYQRGFEVARLSNDVLAKLVQETERLLHSRPISPGVYDVVGGPNIAGVIAHEAFGHGVEADMFLKKRAKAVEYFGKQVASPLVNLYDSPNRPGLSGSYFFDDEGMPASETRIIEDGILSNTLTDHRSAVLLGFKRTSNGRREAFSNKIYARMSNTFFGADHSTLEEMIASIESGLYMPKGSNGMEDPKNWGIQVESPYAVEIKNGKLTDRIYSPIVITGFVPDLLNSISMVGDSVEFEGMGICQKGHKEQIPVAIGGPNLRMRARVG